MARPSWNKVMIGTPPFFSSLTTNRVSGEIVTEELPDGTFSDGAAAVFGEDEELVAGGLSGEIWGSADAADAPLVSGIAQAGALFDAATADFGSAAGGVSGEGVTVCPRDKAAHNTSVWHMPVSRSVGRS